MLLIRYETSTERNVCGAFALLLALGVKLVKIFHKNIKYFNTCYKMSPYTNNRSTIDTRDTVSGENYSRQILLALPPAKRPASQLRAGVDEYRYTSASPLGLNPLKPELNPICYLLALLGAHHFLHVSTIRVKLLTLRLLMSYIYGAPILDVSRSHTTTQHSR